MVCNKSGRCDVYTLKHSLSEEEYIDLGMMPRNGQYELFIYNGWVSCYDDLSLKPFKETDELHEWLEQQPEDQCRKMIGYKVYYLQPILYTWFKLRWI